MFVSFKDIPAPIWKALLWLVGADVPPPCVLDIRDATKLGLLYTGAVNWFMAQHQVIRTKSINPGLDDSVMSAAPESAGTLGSIWITSHGRMAFQWRAEQVLAAEQMPTPKDDNPNSVEKQKVACRPDDKHLPWGGPEWDALAPQTRRLLRRMHGREFDQLEEFTDVVWEKDDVTPGALHAAICRANQFLSKHNYPRNLEKVRREGVIRWV
jgi:hypothetical protein